MSVTGQRRTRGPRLIPSWGAATDRGGRRRHQDRYGALRRGGETLFVLADGMGGHPGGEVAASLAVDSLLEGFAAGQPPLGPSLLQASRRVRAEGERNPSRRGLGTTIAVAWIRGVRLFHAHAGDSRIYHLRGGGARLLTPPHELAEILGREGVLLPEEVAKCPLRGQLSSYLGMVAPEIFEGSVDLEVGDRIALVSDGTLEAGESRLLKALAKADLQDAAEEVVRGHASKDNATALVVEIAEVSPCLGN